MLRFLNKLSYFDISRFLKFLKNFESTLNAENYCGCLRDWSEIFFE